MTAGQQTEQTVEPVKESDGQLVAARLEDISTGLRALATSTEAVALIKAYYLSNYDDLADAVLKLGSTPVTLIIGENFTVTTDVATPETMYLWPVNGAQANISADKTLLIYSREHIIISKRVQFHGNVLTGGTLAFTKGGTMNAEMWHGGGADWYAALQAGIDAGGHLDLLEENYTYDTTLKNESSVKITGTGMNASILTFNGDGVAYTPKSQFTTMRDFQIFAGSGAHTHAIASVEGYADNGWQSSEFENLIITGFDNDYGIKIGDATDPDYSMIFINVDVRNGAGGMHIYNGNDITLIRCNMPQHTGDGLKITGVKGLKITGGNYAASTNGISIEAIYGGSITGTYMENVDVGIKLLSSAGQIRGLKIVGNYIQTNVIDGLGMEIDGVNDIGVENNTFRSCLVGIKAGYNYNVTGLDIGSNNYMDSITKTAFGPNMSGYTENYRGVTSAGSFVLIDVVNSLSKIVSIPYADFGNTKIVQVKRSPIPATTHYESTGGVSLTTGSNVTILYGLVSMSISGILTIVVGDEMAVYGIHANTIIKLHGTANTNEAGGNAYAHIDGNDFKITNNLGDTQWAIWHITYIKE